LTQRFIDECVDEEISLGDFVLTGGENPCFSGGRFGGAAFARCVGRRKLLYRRKPLVGAFWSIPILRGRKSGTGRAVPEVLLSGNHEKIRKWRRREALLATRAKRPDLWAKFTPTKEDVKLLEEE
jgi:tRNA (guanine37-N1)-methyltransferase